MSLTTAQLTTLKAAILADGVLGPLTSGDAINIEGAGLVVVVGDKVTCSALTYTAMP